MVVCGTGREANIPLPVHLNALGVANGSEFEARSQTILGRVLGWDGALECRLHYYSQPQKEQEQEHHHWYSVGLCGILWNNPHHWFAHLGLSESANPSDESQKVH